MVVNKGPYAEVLLLLVLFTYNRATVAHNAKDFDDSILYNIDFEVPDFEKYPELKNHVRAFYTGEHEKYECVIPNVQESKEERDNIKTTALNPIFLLMPIFNKPSCSYRIEAYWSYEICHGYFVRQYHEEREGQVINSQEYYLGKWSNENLEKLKEEWEEFKKAGTKLKTLKINNIDYPYFEMIMTDGTTCDINNAPRTTVVRYICYPHGKNEIHSLKETSSCNYEAVILTSALCAMPLFHPEESKDISIKCYNSLTEPHKPLGMLRQELNELLYPLDDFLLSKEGNEAATTLTQTSNTDKWFTFINSIGSDVDKLVISLTKGNGGLTSQEVSDEKISGIKKPPTSPTVSDLSPVLEFIKGKTCLTGGSGWWKYEFCYGNYVRQFHKDKKSESELFLGYFNAEAHRQWIQMNPDKGPQKQSSSIWHHYEKGSKCDRTGLPREVDVKMTCSSSSSMNPSAVSMYLLEPKTCQYILVFESSMVCKLMGYIDEHGLIDENSLQKMLNEQDATASTFESGIDNDVSPVHSTTPEDIRL